MRFIFRHNPFRDAPHSIGQIIACKLCCINLRPSEGTARQRKSRLVGLLSLFPTTPGAIRAPSCLAKVNVSSTFQRDTLGYGSIRVWAKRNITRL